MAQSIPWISIMSCGISSTSFNIIYQNRYEISFGAKFLAKNVLHDIMLSIIGKNIDPMQVKIVPLNT